MNVLEQALVKGRSNPLLFARVLWPRVTFYKQQREIIEAVRDDDEVYVVAGNMLGEWPPA